MARKAKKITTSPKSSKMTSKKERKVTIHRASTLEDLGLNKIQAKTIGTMFTKENMGPYSISKVTGIPRRKVMKTLEIQKLKTYSPGSYK
jgi:hypothetical protein